jgi:hypothetical protein
VFDKVVDDDGKIDSLKVSLEQRGKAECEVSA